jgi:hypothetical protein
MRWRLRTRGERNRGCSPALSAAFSLRHTASARCSADPFSRKEWYDIKAPAMFNVRVAGKTPVTRTTGTSA